MVLLSQVQNEIGPIRGERRRKAAFLPWRGGGVTKAFSSEVDTGSRWENASKDEVITLSWESVRCAHGK
jgi:hypothetical protein